MVIFDLDWIEWLFGRTTSVMAEAAKVSQVPADIDDTFQMVSRFAGNPKTGAPAGVRGSFVSSVAYRVPGRTLEVACEQGQISWDSRTHQVVVYTASDGKWRHFVETDTPQYSFERMYHDELDHFLRAVRGELTYMRDFQDVRRMLDVLCAVEQSSTQGKRIELEH